MEENEMESPQEAPEFSGNTEGGVVDIEEGE